MGFGKKLGNGVAGLGKKVGSGAIGLGKKTIKVAGTIAAVGGAALKIHSIATGQSVSDSAVDLIETAKDVKETADDVKMGVKVKADIERVADDDKETKLQKAKAMKSIVNDAKNEKEERNRKRQENRLEKPKEKKAQISKEAEEKAKNDALRKDREEKSRIARVMKEAEANMKSRNLGEIREKCYGKTKSGKKGRLNLSMKDKKKCDKKHKLK